MKKKLIRALTSAMIASLLAAGALAEVQEGVRVAGSNLPYIVGGIAAIALGVFLFAGMVARGDGKTVVVLGNGLPLPMPLLSLAICVAAGIGLFQMKPSDTYVLDGVRYALSETQAKAVGFSEDAEIPQALSLPDRVDGVPLTEVSGFSGADIREVTLPVYVTRIGDKAFQDCASLTTVRLRKHLASIGKEAFRGCASLERIALIEKSGDDVHLVIKEGAFRDCASLRSFDLPEGIDKLGDGAFEGCSALEAFHFTKKLDELGARCFAGCASLKSITLEAQTVPEGAFRDCASLVAADLQSSETVEKSAFENCGALRCVSAAYADKFGSRAFANCPELRAVGIGYEARKLPKDLLENSPRAVLYNSGTGKTQAKAEKLGMSACSDRFFSCECLPDGTLRLTDWHWGEGEGAFTVPATWCELPVSAVSLYKSTGQANSVYEYPHREIVVEEGIRILEDKCFYNWQNALQRLHLPNSIESIGEEIVTSRYHKDLVVVTDNPVAAEYARHWDWKVESPASAP